MVVCFFHSYVRLPVYQRVSSSMSPMEFLTGLSSADRGFGRLSRPRRFVQETLYEKADLGAFNQHQDGVEDMLYIQHKVYVGSKNRIFQSNYCASLVRKMMINHEDHQGERSTVFEDSESIQFNTSSGYMNIPQLSIGET